MTRPGEWVAVETASASTLRLAASLAEAGYEAFAPVEVIKRRSRSGAKPETVTLPVIPRYVFVRAIHLADMIELSHSPSLLFQVWDAELRRMVTKGHPHFRLFKPMGEIRYIPDHQLDHLRFIDRKAKPLPTLNPGDPVRLEGAGFDGLRGEVVSSRKKRVRVKVIGWGSEIDLPAWSVHLDLDETADSGVSPSQFSKAA